MGASIGTRWLGAVLGLVLGCSSSEGGGEGLDAGDGSPAVDAAIGEDAAAADGAPGADGGSDAGCAPTTCEALGADCGVVDDGCGTLLTCGDPCPITLDMDFDHGSLDVAASRVEGDVVHLVGRDNGNSGAWKWIYFRLRHVADRSLSFVISDDFASGSGRLENHEMVYSYDQVTWAFFDDNVLDGAAGELRFSNADPFVENEVFVAYGLPYPLMDAVSLVESARASEHVSPTASGDSMLVIGQTAGGTDDLGRDIGPHDLHGFVITDSSAAGPKAKVVLSGGVHANETTGSHALHGLVEWLLGADAEAAALRRAAEIYVYPMVNPDGRFAGYNRHTVQAVSEDPNREWDSGRWGNNQEVRIVAQAMVADTGGDVDYFLDFHSTVGTGAHYAYLDMDGNFTGRDMRTDPFWTSLQSRDPLAARDGTYVARTAMRWGVTALDAEFSSTVEMYFRPDENVERYRALGEAMGRALGDALVD